MATRNDAVMGHGDDRETRTNQALTGVVLVIVGIAILAGRMDIWEIQIRREMWPWIPIAIGLVRFLVPPLREGRRSRRGGAWLIYIGIWGLISEYALYDLGYRTSWPLLVVGAGLNMVWRALEQAPRRASGEE